MRLLHVMATAQTSGGASHLLALLPELVRLGCEVSAATGADGPLATRLESIGVRTYPLELHHSRLDPTAPARLARVVRASGADLVHLHGTRAAFFAALARPLAQRPLVYTVHGLSYRQEARALARAAFFAAEAVACRAAAHVISVSRPDLADLRRRRFVSEVRSSHVPNALDLARFTPGAPGDRARLRDALGLPRAASLVGTVARLVPGKAIVDLLEAARRVARPVVVVIAGDGPERGALEAGARAAGIEAIFLGERQDVPDILRALDVFVLPSRWEGEPLSLLEALASGVPCVSTRTTGAVDLVGDSPAAELCRVGDPAGLAAAIDAWTALSEAERARRGALGRALVEGRDAAAMARRTLAVYQAVLAA